MKKYSSNSIQKMFKSKLEWLSSCFSRKDRTRTCMAYIEALLCKVERKNS